MVGLQFVGSSRWIATSLLMVSEEGLDADFSLALERPGVLGLPQLEVALLLRCKLLVHLIGIVEGWRWSGDFKEVLTDPAIMFV